MRQKLAEFSPGGQVSSSTSNYRRPVWTETASTLLTWSSADHQETIDLLDLNGKPVVNIWNEKQQLSTQLTFSSWGTLLYSALLASRGSRNSEDFDSQLRTLFGLTARSWLRFTPPTSFVIRDKMRCFLRMSDGLLELLEGHSKLSLSESSLSEVQQPSKHCGENFSRSQREPKSPTTSRIVAVPGKQTGPLFALEFHGTERQPTSSLSVILKARSEDTGVLYLDTWDLVLDEETSDSLLKTVSMIISNLQARKSSWNIASTLCSQLISSMKTAPRTSDS